MRMKLHKKMVDRMKAEGTMKQYMRLRRFFELYRDEKGEGFDPALHSRIAAAAFPPKDGSQPEFFNDPLFAEILSNWKNNKYPKPPDFDTYVSGATNFSKFKEEPSEELKAAAEEIKQSPKKVENLWHELVKQGSERKASPLEEVQWVYDNYPRELSQIDPASVPSSGAVGLLQYVKKDISNYGDFIRTGWFKLLPTKSELEYANRFKDSGQELNLLEEFERSLQLENESQVQTEDAA
jgi:hypothetical protein